MTLPTHCAGRVTHHQNGLGNLFFDQVSLCAACRPGTVERHIFYNGKHMQTELLPYQVIDHARPRPMMPAEEAALWRELYAVSGWSRFNNN